MLNHNGMKDIYRIEYKKNVFAKVTMLYLYVYEDHIEGTGIESNGKKWEICSFNILLDDVIDISKREIEGENYLVIEYRVKTLNTPRVYSVFFPEFYNMDSALGIKERWDEEKRKKDEKERERKERLERKELEKKQQYEMNKVFYERCFDFHIRTDNNPYYTLHDEGLQFLGIYIDKNKSINFVSIDGDNQAESNACILYEDIHYYEKAGSIHYTSEINGKHENFGGSFKGGTISKGIAGVAGLLFGPMGMMAGALFTHKPAQATPSTSSFQISSEVVKIDDRSVILNYYSKAKNLLMDIELPADIYNFLQTHLPDRKYGIVLELEKKKSIDENTGNLAIFGSSDRAKITSSDMQEFENRIKKLMIMKENGLLSEEEFAAEKRRILEEV